MTPPVSVVDTFVARSGVLHPWRRRVAALLLALIFGLLALYPRAYRVAASLTPSDPSTFGLGGALGQTGALSNVFGNQAAVEISLKVARSVQVRQMVIRKLDLVRAGNFKDEAAAGRWLSDKVTIRSIRGGIIQIETQTRDTRQATAVVTAFIEAIRGRLAQISRQQTAYKRDVLVDLVRTAGTRLDRAQIAYDQFRRNTRYATPGTALGAIGARVPLIEAQLKAKEVELRSARSFATDQNMTVRQIKAEMAALREQLGQARSLNATDPGSVNRVVVETTKVQDLERELNIARGLYDAYRRFLEGAAVEDLTATVSVRVLEPPYVDDAWQIKVMPAVACVLILLAALATEIYLMRPPLGTAVRLRESDIRG